MKKMIPLRNMFDDPVTDKTTEEKIRERILNYMSMYKLFINIYENIDSDVSLEYKIKKLLERIQTYSFGIILLDYIYNHSIEISKFDKYISELFKLSLMASLTIFYDPIKKCHYYNMNGLHEINTTYTGFMLELEKNFNIEEENDDSEEP